MTTAELVRGRRRRRFSAHTWVPYAFVAPFSVLFVVFIIAPIVVAIFTSVFAQQTSGLGFDGPQTVFVGVANYLRALTDTAFLSGFGRVFLYGIVQVPVMMLIAGVMALLLDSALVKAKRFFQFAVFVPYAIPGVVAALLWGFLYQPGVSPIVQWLRSVGIPADFLAPGTVLWSIANISLWSYAGVNMIILFSALQGVPRDMYEAAKLDGAGEFRIAMSIKLPMIAPAVALTTLSTIIGTLQLFNEPQVLKSISNNVSSSFTPNMSIYFASTTGNNPNYASAMAVLLGVVTLLISILLLRVGRKDRTGGAR